MLLLWMMLLVAPQELASLDQADQLKRDGRYFDAEQLYLSVEPTAQTQVRLGLALAELNLLLGNNTSRRAVYQAYLTRSAEWRSVACIVLAALNFDKRRMEQFGTYATIFLTEDRGNDPIRWRLLYALARYTTVDLQSVSLSPLERRWVQRCRSLTADQTFPSSFTKIDMPIHLKWGFLLEASPSTIPEVEENMGSEDQIVLLLGHARAALAKGQLVEAGQLFNQASPKLKALGRADCFLPYFQLLTIYFKKLGKQDQVETARKNYETYLNRSILPFVLLPQYLVNVPVEAPAPASELAAAQNVEAPPSEIKIFNKPPLIVDPAMPRNAPAPVESVVLPTHNAADETKDETAPTEPQVPEPKGETAPTEPQVPEPKDETVPTEPQAPEPVVDATPAPPEEQLEAGVVSVPPPEQLEAEAAATPPQAPEPKITTAPTIIQVPEPKIPTAPTSTQTPSAKSPAVALKDASPATASVPAPNKIPLVTVRATTQEANKPVISPTASQPGSGNLTHEQVEDELLMGQRDRELSIRQLPTDTQYYKIYRNYLFGLHFLLVNRLAEAYDRLSVANAQIVDLPFPTLELKIMLGLAEYYERSNKGQKAEWYRLQALQIWSAPENLALIASAKRPMPSPALELLDAVLKVPGQNNAHSLLYYSELQSFSNLIHLAYRRGVLSANPVVSNQIRSIGGQLLHHIEALALKPDERADPGRYNETLSLWHKLWAQAIYYYREPSYPGVKDLQQALLGRDRIVSFIEGEDHMGVLIISKTQAFTLPLGRKAAFLGLKPADRLGFLVGRLGPFWESEGDTLLSLSPSFRESDLLESVQAKISKPEKLRFIFSLKAFATPQRRGQCQGTVVFADAPLGLVLKTDRIERLPLKNLDRFALSESLGRNGNLVYQGPLILDEKGLVFGSKDSTGYFHELIHKNASLCSLTLVVDSKLAWTTSLSELELLNASSALCLNLIHSDQLPASLNLETSTSGVHFP